MNASDRKHERIKALVGMLKGADIAYYRDDDPIMTDREYDRLFNLCGFNSPPLAA